MNLLLEKLRPLGFNDRPLTETDFHRICEAEHIEIVWSDTKFSFYFSAFGLSCITLPKRLRGLRLLFAMYHELAHHFLHAGKQPSVLWLKMPHENGKEETEADALACIALIPKRDLGKFGILDEYPRGFAKKIYNDRLRIYFLFGV